MSPTREKPSGRGVAILAAALWLLWVGLAGSWEFPELVAGALAVLLAAWIVRAIGLDPASLLFPSSVDSIVRAPVRLAREVGALSGALVGRLLRRTRSEGRIHARDCRAVERAEDEARALYRESFFPMRFALGCDRSTREIVLHELSSSAEE